MCDKINLLEKCIAIDHNIVVEKNRRTFKIETS